MGERDIVERLIDSQNGKEAFDLVAYLWRFPWFPAESPFGEDAEMTARLAAYSIEDLMELDNTLGEIAAAARGAQQLLREEFRARAPSGKARFGDQVYAVSRSSRWEVISDPLFWTAVHRIAMDTADRNLVEEDVEYALGVIRRILPTRNVRVTALRAEAKRAGIDPEVVDDTLLQRRWSESWTAGWRPLADVPGAADVPDDGGIIS